MHETPAIAPGRAGVIAHAARIIKNISYAASGAGDVACEGLLAAAR